MKRIVRAYTILALWVAATVTLPAQTFTTLHTFDGTDGNGLVAGLVQAVDGELYGTTMRGGTNGVGTIFKITPGGTLTTLHNFCSQSLCRDGESPYAGLVQATNGDLYGTTFTGTDYGAGTIFKITPNGVLTTLYTFSSCSPTFCPGGGNAESGLVQAANGDLYGTTASNVGGTVFKVTPRGTLSTLYNFCSQSDCTDGKYPYAGLAQATNGDLYGTTPWGGANYPPQGSGTLFKIAQNGVLTTLHNFCSQSGCADGGNPYGALVQASDGNLYGTASSGGAYGRGTVFEITPSGALTTLYSFCAQSGCPDGEQPFAGLVRATDGNLYGTTQFGGANGYGTIFKIATGGTLTTLYSFCSQPACTDGGRPIAVLVQDTNGSLYGTTQGEGASGGGTVFRLSVGLGPFVKTLPTVGIVGEGVRILGSDLTGATSVTFNGIATAFTVVSAREISTTVPTGATTGKVEVVTPSGTLVSNVSFLVP